MHPTTSDLLPLASPALLPDSTQPAARLTKKATMDEFSAYHITGNSKQRPARIRTKSFNTAPPLRENASASALETRNDWPLLRNRESSASIRSVDSDVSEIIAPIPRRDLLHTYESNRWLHSPSHSPSSSRPVSPVSQTTSNGHGPRHTRPLSFSTLMDHEKPRRSPVSPSFLRNESRMHMRPKRESGHEEYGAGKRWIRWMHKHGMKHLVVPAAILGSAWIRWCIGLGSYSGQNTPPMYGDYEAQRHWMELTIHLPIQEWYKYDLQYWGLDYPPLTAYVSWLCGIVGSWINPTWFALDSSRGIESQESLVYMRSTALAFDTLVYIPALLLFLNAWQGTRSKRTQELALLILLLQPALLLVDFGHFQYNSVMLGLTLLALDCFAKGQDALGALFFVLSLGFKQMALYYAPAIGTYLLGKCIYLGFLKGGRLFIQLGIVTVATFILLFLPFLPPLAPITAILDPITRIFPFNRGLFEDKVANFWCASNVAFKWKNWASREALVKLSTALTAVGFLPSVAGLIRGSIISRPTSGREDQAASTPTLPLLPYALLSSSMSFFLFSFQVHEKTILLPLLPMTLLLSGASPNSSVYAWGVLANNVGVFSMWPLLKRDGLAVQYIATLVLWNTLIGYNPLRLQKNSVAQLLSLAVYPACLLLHILELVVTPPPRYPDLFPVLNVLVSTPVFIMVWLWSIKCGIEIGWALGGLPGSSSSKDKIHKGPTNKIDRDRSREGRADGGASNSRSAQGTRATSLGFSQGRKRGPYRPASVDTAVS